MRVFKLLLPALALLLLHVIPFGRGQSPSLAQLDFHQPDGSRLIVKLEEGDMAANTGYLVNFLKTAIVACATGIWRFYPNTNFTYDAGTFSGYQIGLDEKRHCYDISGANEQLANMSSYRVLGPINGPDLDLDQQSITIYSEQVGSGLAKSYRLGDDFPITNISTIDFVVESFLITGRHNEVDTESPVFNAISDPNGDAGAGAVCIVLVDPAGNRERMLFAPKMEYDDGTRVIRNIDMGSLMYYPYSILDLIPGMCGTRWTVPTGTVAQFNEIPELFY